MIILNYHQPYNWDLMINFLSRRATPGVEHVENGIYSRSIQLGDDKGLLEVSHDNHSNQLAIKLTNIDKTHQTMIKHKISKMFDLDLNPQIMLSRLKKDPTLYSIVKANPGLRLPGCWDGFEIAVRAITGQQISVTGATTVMGKIIVQYGQKYSNNSPVTHLFPSPQALADLSPESLPMPKARANTIASLAKRVHSGDLNFEAGQNIEKIMQQLLSIKGIGPWTAHYIAMRAFSHADALLEGDLVLEKKAAKLYAKPTRMKTSELLEHAEKWRPWRAYAAIHIWNMDD